MAGPLESRGKPAPAEAPRGRRRPSAASAGPFRFDREDSPLRQRHPLAKLTALLVLSATASLGSPLALAGAGAAGGLALALAGVFRRGMGKGLRELGRDARFLIPLLLFVAAFRLVDPFARPVFRLGELGGVLLYGARLLAVYAYAEAFFRSTTAAELAAALSGLARRLFRRRDLDPGLYLSLAIGFIPRCFAAYAAARDAALARGFGGLAAAGGNLAAAGGGRKGGSGSFGALRALKGEFLLLGSFAARSIKAALSSAEALEARGYDPRRELLDRRLDRSDLVFSLLALAAAGGLLALG